jgi:hypothetical protein
MLQRKVLRRKFYTFHNEYAKCGNESVHVLYACHGLFIGRKGQKDRKVRETKRERKNERRKGVSKSWRRNY